MYLGLLNTLAVPQSSFTPDAEDLFIAHVAAMDMFARALVVADTFLTQTDYKKMKKSRYASYDNGDGAKFEKDQLTLEDLYNIAKSGGEPKQISGKQELLEQMLTMYI
ncbi:MAG TPA: hypothetical protein VHO28_03750 [Ignavibacteriales bacterium]|nr:hypothetical protein [Ignavibacteriales bacterium]